VSGQTQAGCAEDEGEGWRERGGGETDGDGRGKQSFTSTIYSRRHNFANQGRHLHKVS
jgi:hypothetical protein